MIDQLLLEKYNKLKQDLTFYKRVSVGFSSGVDSTFLLFAAKEALGENVIAVTGESESFPKREYMEASEFCKKYGIRQIIVYPGELKIEEYVKNPPNRCYICKKTLFTKIIEVSKENDVYTVLEGSNLDDMGDYRPGLQAIKELGVKSPLRENGFTKAEIRELSDYFNLPTSDKPAYACLASRFPYGENITAEKLSMVDKAEQCLIDMGYKQVRVRIHGDIARIELMPEDFESFMKKEVREKVNMELKKIGFSYVSLDLQGYRTGSMNEKILKK